MIMGRSQVNESGEINVSGNADKTQTDGSPSGITGAVIGAFGSTQGMIITVIIVIVLGIAFVVVRVRKR